MTHEENTSEQVTDNTVTTPENMLEAIIDKKEHESWFTRIKRIYRNLPTPVKWLFNLINTVFGVGLISFVLIIIRDNTFAETNLCRNFPIAYEFVRQQTCPSPTEFPDQDFVIVLARLAYFNGNGNFVDNLTISNRAYTSLENSLADYEFPDVLGDFHVVSYNSDDNNRYWIDRITENTNLLQNAELHQERFNADLVIYGVVTLNHLDQIVFSPSVFIAENALSDGIFENDFWGISSLGQIIFAEGNTSTSFSDWIQAVRAMTLGLGYLQNGNRSEALVSFEELANSQIPELSAIGHIYAGNIAMEVAIQAQINFEEMNNCVATRCSSYGDNVKDAYRRAWNHYSSVLDLQVNENVMYRALVGRGNVHYRISQIVRLEISGERGDTVRYNCHEDGLLLLDDVSDPIGEYLNWVERSYAAIACYEQAERIAPARDEGLLKIVFGEAQVIQWLVSEDIEDASVGIQAYTNVNVSFGLDNS